MVTEGAAKKAPSTEKAAEWRPDYPIKYAPVFVPSDWSVRNLLAYTKGFLMPWNLIYLTVAALSHFYTTPELERCKEFQFGWINQLFWRNQVLLWIFAGGWHLLLHTFRVNGTTKKYDPKWPSHAPKFMFGHQTYENVFMSCVSGVLFWTAFEAIFMKLWATGRVPVVSISDSPIYSVLQFILIPYWREFHFYWTHRMIHWKPLYNRIHYFHHKNVNPGPWSGLSMHPIEHLFYFSVLIPHAFIPGHPLHLFFNAQHTALTPAGGHHGFEGPVWDDQVPTGSYFHYLHHRYFECNYGEASIPLDKWFGSFRDGKSQKPKDREPAWVTATTVAVGISIGVAPLVPFIMGVM